tara:strand:+ start:422 stop:853 length:432 start_codon:yes stop_codon:yes gene_type:complete
MNGSLDTLTRDHPVEETLGGFMGYWTDPNLTGMHMVSFFRSSPAGNSHAEMAMGNIVAESAQRGEWVAYDTKWGPEDFEAYQRTKRGEGRPTHMDEGLKKAEEAGLMRVELRDGTVHLVPTQALVDLTRERAERYSQPRDQRD